MKNSLHSQIPNRQIHMHTHMISRQNLYLSAQFMIQIPSISTKISYLNSLAMDIGVVYVLEHISYILKWPSCNNSILHIQNIGNSKVYIYIWIDIYHHHPHRSAFISFT